MRQDSVSSPFLTWLDTECTSEPSSNASTKRSIKEFKCPPLRESVTKSMYYSLDHSSTTSRYVLSDREKEIILARLKKPAKVEEAAFQLRLSRIKTRNGYKHIEHVKNKMHTLDQEVAAEREQAFQTAEARREQIAYRRRNLSTLLRQEKNVHQARVWMNIIVSHLFLTALMQERKVQQAMDTFVFLLAPMVSRFLGVRRRRRMAAALTTSHMKDIPFPCTQVIQSMHGTFFTGWPPSLLEKLAAKGKPMYIQKGAYIMHEGDLSRVMYMITLGTVSIILRKRGVDKRRNKGNSTGVFEIHAPCYVGEFALVCKEPRSASIYCETDVGLWAVSPEDYDGVARLLSPEIASKQREATDVRRRQNLQKFFPLRVDFLRQFPFFEHFSDESLTAITTRVEPIVLHDGDYLYKLGDMDSSAYFILDGTAVLRECSGKEAVVATGSCIGMFECSCGVNERKTHSIVSVNYCDVWQMRRETLIDVGMTEPAAFLHCRKAAKTARANEIPRDKHVPAVIKHDPFLSFCLTASLKQRFYELGTPCVYLNGERLVLMGQQFNDFVVLVNGTVDVTVATNGKQETFRISIADHRYEGKKEESSHRAVSDSAKSVVKEQACVFGAYEFAASLTQYTCTATSHGLSEAYLVERQKFDAVLPPELKHIINGNIKGRESVANAYKHRDPSILRTNQQNSFAHIYKVSRDVQREKKRQDVK